MCTEKFHRKFRKHDQKFETQPALKTSRPSDKARKGQPGQEGYFDGEECFIQEDGVYKQLIFADGKWKPVYTETVKVKDMDHAPKNPDLGQTFYNRDDERFYIWIDEDEDGREGYRWGKWVPITG